MGSALTPRMTLVLKNLASQDGGDVGQDRPQSTRAELVYPWESPVKLSAQTALSNGTISEIGSPVAWSPCGRFLAFAVGNTSPYVEIFERSGSNFTALSDPATLPTGQGYSVAWSPDSRFLAVAHAVTPFITIYERSGTTFTKLADPASLPTATLYNLSFSPNGDWLAAGPYVYQRSGTTFTRATPGWTAAGRTDWSPDSTYFYTYTGSSQPRVWRRDGTSFSTAWSGTSTGDSPYKTYVDPSGRYWVMICNNSGSGMAVYLYKKTGVDTWSEFGRMNQVTGAPTTWNRVWAWHPSGRIFAVARESTGTYIEFHKIEDGIDTYYDNQKLGEIIVGGDCTDLEWSPDGRFLAVLHKTSPYWEVWETSGGFPPEGGLVEVLNFGLEEF